MHLFGSMALFCPKPALPYHLSNSLSLLSLENDLQRLATISRHDALRPSDHSNTDVDRCLCFSNATGSTPKLNCPYYRTFAFYQWMSKLDVPFYNLLLWPTSATLIYKTCSSIQQISLLLSSLVPARVNVLDTSP